MSDTLSVPQISSLGKEFVQFAQTLNNYLNTNDISDDQLYDLLSSKAEQCARLGANFSIQDAQTQFADSDQAFRQLLGVTTDANAAADALVTEVAQISREVQIASGMIALAESLGSGSPDSVVKAIGDLHSAIWAS